MRARPRAGLARLHDPALAYDPDPERALELLRSFLPPDKAQADFRVRICQWILEKDYPFERKQLDGHLTASALLLNPTGERALLTHHKKLGRWLQFGGHADGDANLAGVALRECMEESGIEGLMIDPRPIDLDIHPIPARKDEPEHLHLDVRFLVWTPDEFEEKVSEESIELGWIGFDEQDAHRLDDSVRRLFERARGD